MQIIPPVKRSWPVLASTLLLCLAFPPFNLSLLVFVALVPWLLSLQKADGRGALRSGFWLGLIFSLVQMIWMLPFVGKWTGSYLLAAIPWALSSLVMSAIFPLAGWLIQKCWTLGRPWMIPLVWAGIEALRSSLPALAWPWGLLATPLYRVPWAIQHASFGTIHMVSAWVVLANVIVACMMLVPPSKEIKKEKTPTAGIPGTDPRRVFRMGALFFILLAASMARYQNPVSGKEVLVSVGQPGVDMAFTSSPQYRPKLEQALGDIFLSATLQQPHLLVLPEGLAYGGEELPPKTPFPQPPPVPVIFGGQRSENGKNYQSAYAFDGRWQVVDKTRLVIFGEYVPFRDKLPFLDHFRLPSGDLHPGKESKILEINGIKTGPLICFEGLFTEGAIKHQQNGAQLLTVMSVDDWYMGTPAIEQFKAASIWRAVESGLPVARAASLGVSLAVDARGNILTEAPTGKTITMRTELTLPEKGDGFVYRFVFVWVCFATCVAVLLEVITTQRKQSRSQEVP